MTLWKIAVGGNLTDAILQATMSETERKRERVHAKFKENV